MNPKPEKRRGSAGRRVEIGVALTMIMIAGSVSGETASNSWINLNYTPCENIGILGSGRINGSVVFERRKYQDWRTREWIHTQDISSLSFVTTGYSIPHRITGRIEYEVGWTSSGNPTHSSLVLENAWFSAIGEAGSTSLYLPRVQTSATGPSAGEQQHISKKAGTPIKVKIQVVFQTDAGNCTSSFSESWAF